MFGRQAAGRSAGRRIAAGSIVAALAVAVLMPGFAQIAKRRPADKGPRALGLIQLASNGKAQLIPVAIMINREFYDAGVYKADPVPMALQSEIVYEGLKAGVSQGLFTVTGAFHTQQLGWEAAGKWRSAADIEAEKAKAKAEAAKKGQTAPPPEQDIGGPPKLKRAPGSSEGPSSQSTAQKPQEQPEHSASTSGSPASTSSSRKASSSSEQANSPSSSMQDPNRPVLRRQAPSETTHEQTKEGTESEPLKGPLDFIPAISDADGPQPRPYTYQLKPDEQQALLKKMQAMAGDEVRARAAHLATERTAANSKTPAKKSKFAPAPEFNDVQMRAFDLTSTNEPVLVFTAQAKISPVPDLDFMVTLVARQDIYADLHKVFVQTTDDKHLDVLPRYDFIDAVDANGDGVGELLFRKAWDSGTAFSIYSVIGDQLWPLFEGKPGT